MSHVQRARKLRRDQTEAEGVFWNAVRGREFADLKWKRQVPIDRYFADFVCEQKKLIVELDGGQHGDNIDYDEKRTAVLEKYGYRVLRFWNDDVMKYLDSVLEEIEDVANAYSPHPAAASPRGPLPEERL